MLYGTLKKGEIMSRPTQLFTNRRREAPVATGPNDAAADVPSTVTSTSQRVKDVFSFGKYTNTLVASSGCVHATVILWPRGMPDEGISPH